MPTILGKIRDNNTPIVKVRISNEVPCLSTGVLAPAVIKTREINALVDTGASNSAIDTQVAKYLLLQQTSSRPVLFPNMETTEFAPIYLSSISFLVEDGLSQKWSNWPDLVNMLSLNLNNQFFDGVIGMDLISKGSLSISGQHLRFKYG